MSTPAGAGRGTAASPGRGGRGGRGKGRGGRNHNNSGGRNGSNKGRGGDNNNNSKGRGDINNSNGGKDGASATTPSGKSNGGRGGGGRRRHFSARGGAGRGNGGGGRGSSDSVGSKTPPPQATEEDTPKIENGVEEKVKKMNDQEILITFGPYVRSGDPEAKNIHQEYLSNSRQRDFINNARRFLVQQESKPKTKAVPNGGKPKSEGVSNEEEGGDNNKNNLNGGMKEGTSEMTGNHDSPAVGNAPAKMEPPQKPTPAATSLPRPPPGLQVPIHHVGNVGTKDTSNSIPSRLPPGLTMPPQSQATRNPPGPPPGMPPPMRPPKTEEMASPPPKSNSITSSILPARTPTPTGAPKAADTAPATTTPAKPVRVRRTQTRCEQQPGRLFANDMPAAAFNSAPAQSNNRGTSLTARPRSELTARWILPLPFLRNRALRRFEEQKALNRAPPENLTIRDALNNLSVGLFRRGAMDSGSQSSIVSKEILASKNRDQSGRPSEDYFFNVDQRTDSVFGTVPFYAPRTPGNVVFRLYYEDEPHVTLATGPCIHVIPSVGDLDSVLRFILSNFKSKKTNGISSMNSLASVFELFSPRQNDRYFDGAGRVAWGCICESRKVVDHAGSTYTKKKRELEEKMEAEKIKDELMSELPDLDSLGIEAEAKSSAQHDEEKDKTSDAKAKWASEEYTNERKWKEIQLIYSSILKAAVTNEANQLLLKRDILSKIRLEYDLWCPLKESFAPNPFVATNDEASKFPGDVSAFPQSIVKEHVKKCHDARSKMQEQLLGFVPISSRPTLLKAKGYKWKKNGKSIFQELTSAMNEIYANEYAVSDNVWKRREKVRATIEHVMSTSGAFPPGTKVAVFGSSANGFGSPLSDLDLCLQVPLSAINFTKENGVEAMTELATKFAEAGMTEVDTVRLTARIPIVKFNVPYNGDGEEILVECDLSLQNPLACLNTSLLHAYSKISPSTQVLASIIKRWAKSRDINNPSHHTLSSYGYVIMLIYFLTSRDFTKDGYVIAPENPNQTNPILPNLQWVDPTWAQNPTGPYREIPAKPKTQHTMVQHPTEANYYVNSYFYRSGLEGLKQFCSNNHNAETSLGAILASFFYYFAYEFDYKKNVVSLNTKHSSPHTEREVKAEEDGWSLFRHGLAIEDPFELFYDVAHVLKATNFQHIRKEFSLAYTKIANSAYTNGDLPTGREVIDLICEPVDDQTNSA